MTYALSPADLIQCRAINMRYRDRVKEIALAVSAATSVPISAIYGPRKPAGFVRARQLVMYLAHKEGLSQPAIGDALNRDHTTVHYGIKAEMKRRGELPGIAQ